MARETIPSRGDNDSWIVVIMVSMTAWRERKCADPSKVNVMSLIPQLLRMHDIMPLRDAFPSSALPLDDQDGTLERGENGKHGKHGRPRLTICSSYHQLDGPSEPMGIVLFCVRKCALDPRNRLCQMKASLSRSSMSFSVHSRVGSACRNIKIS